MELNHLKYFFEVARTGGFTRAARTLHVEQPAISRAVKKLEQDLGVVLLERRKRTTTLTKVGQEIYAACARIFEEAENVRRLAESERRECKGPLRFAASSAIAAYLVPRVHLTYLAAHPEVWPITFSGTAASLLDRIAQGQLEFGLFFHVPRLLPRLEESTLAILPFKLVIATSHARDPKVRRCFIGSREVDDESTQAFPTLRRLQRDDPQVQIRISSNDLSAHRNMVLAGLGISILPHFMVADDLKAGRLKALMPREPYRFELKLITRQQQVLSRAARLYLEEIRRTLGGTQLD